MASRELTERDVIAALDDYVVDGDGGPELEVDVDGRRHTVDIRPIYEFEKDILDRLIEPRIANDVTGGAVPLKGQWIHGWLQAKGEDYINSIWKNYQYFLKYIQGRTSKMANVSTHHRSPGTYDSMYRYLLILEELELIERFRTEEVGEDEYDFPVPSEFRERRFIRLTEDGARFSDNKDEWNNPYESLYPGGEKRDVADDDDLVDIDIQPGEPEESGTSDIPDEVEEFQISPEEQTGGETDSPSGEGLEAFGGDSSGEPEKQEIEDVGEDLNLPEEGASFADFPEKESIIALAENNFPEAINMTFEEAPISTPNIEPEDFAIGQMAVFGTWAVGQATPGQSSLELIVSVDDSSASISPGYVPAGIQEHLGTIMRENNPYSDIFPNYITISAYNSAFMRTVDEVIRREQSELLYYDLQDMEFKEL